MKKNNKIFNIAFIGVFAAIIAVVSFTPLRTLGLEITFSMVPIAVGAIVFGPTVGAVLGGVYGIVSFLQCFGFSPFGAALLSINPLLTALVCIPTRILAGWISGLLFKALSRRDGWMSKAAYPVAALAAPLLNTVFFMSMMVLCFYNTEYIQGFVSQLGANNPFTFILLFVGINGAVELACGFAVAMPAAVAVKRVVSHL